MGMFSESSRQWTTTVLEQGARLVYAITRQRNTQDHWKLLCNIYYCKWSYLKKGVLEVRFGIPCRGLRALSRVATF